ncbi:trigger factor [Candidatus Peregrinibacteria bacterium]|jgi:trigger factor|nr:trigger factor [Candidatus Peregrinibacteria bacterium]MBT7703836.1 trigger factor [Candidatus Peregrinibacteria bacterium]
MKVTVSKPEKSMVTITIEADEKDLEKFLEKSAEELSGQVKIDGFRKGKVPKDVLEKHIGKEAIRANALELALPNFYAEAVIQEKVQVVARPEINITSDDPFTFEAKVAVLPEVKISGHEKIKVDKKDLKVTAKDLEEVVDYFRKQGATYPDAKRAAKKGDKVEVDFEGFDPKGDVPLEGTKSKNHPVVLGEGGLIPGFEEEITGMKAGEDKEFEIKFPKDYHSDKFKGKKVKFKIKIHKVQEVKLPELTKDWIKKMTGKELDVDAFHEEVRQNLTQEREQQEKNRREGMFFEELIKLTKVDVPEALIEEEIDFILDRTKMELQSRGITWDQYEKHLGEQKRDLRKEKQEQATKQVTLRLVLNHLYKEEKIEPTDEEIKKEVEQMMGKYPEAEQDKVKANYEKGQAGYAQVHNAICLDRFLKKHLS